MLTHLCALGLLAALLIAATLQADDTRSTARAIQVNSSVSTSISPAGDVDYWRINVPSDKQLALETSGTADTIGVLEDSAGNRIEENDDQDANTNRNFKIDWAVTAGIWHIRVSA